jgi:beta-galactosidase
MLFFVGCLILTITTRAQQKQLFNNDWEFVKGTDSVFSVDMLSRTGAIKWERITLPHTANIEPIEKKEQQWQGICFYRKFFTVPATAKGKHMAIQFDAAMQEADVYLNGRHIFRHLGGYLPFYIDVSDKINAGAENNIIVKLDNRDNPLIPPGKPLKTLDFNYYSGIYRNAWFITKEKTYISNAVAANQVAGGGILVHYENITRQSATLLVNTAVNNDFANAKNMQVRATLTDKTGKKIVGALSGNQPVAANSSITFNQSLVVLAPALWSPETPYLYQLTVEALQDGKVVDKETIATGIKKIRIERDAFYLNDKKVKIKGTNRHQDYPWLGNAVPDNAQYRDAYKIKLAGFNFVRTSHYPQSTAFLNACDELGIMVMDAIPGWQFAGNDSFRVNSYQDIHDMIHRDRNHASIVLWEASLNESGMKKDYMQKAHNIVHEELPFAGIYSAGWMNDVYDVFLPARQHGKAPDYWKKYNKERPLIIAEYGDWEYYAQNAGFNQTAYKDLQPEERTSRQLRGSGQKRLLQQSLNYQESHNDNFYGPALGDANWLMFDYNRGYAEDIESSGIMDINRLPKFSFYFYQSQVDPANTNAFNKPVLHIANYWQRNTDSIIKIYSNCDEVALLLDGKLVSRQRSDKDQYSTNLKHPPFTFYAPPFRAGTLTAIGYINNKEIIKQQRQTAGAPAAIRLRVDESGKSLSAGQQDVVFVYADIIDSKGNIIYDAQTPVTYNVTGDATIEGMNPVTAEAGTATVLIRAGAKAGKIVITANANGLKQGQITLDAK